MVLDKETLSGMSYSIHHNRVFFSLNYLDSSYYSVIANEMPYAVNGISKREEEMQVVEIVISNYTEVFEKAV